ncbi:hypothetical protein KO02_11320 [Sphingobacterium sp. ML3W]|uniref:nucleotidyltransferase family protein n=1 Tax=Sphingobacterium sp. ML3W TaxID=1538644 RepID=UPI0004F66179|nr:NDP-sugar synthase [Sphingobacterium sp. ML3W]AIM37216.1 hypothetical protein KO02_11320 [Sphingobacterium sp. ML3W]
MEYAIIAAGEGQRLKDEGFKKAKPLLTLLGIPMIERLINVFADQGARSVFIIINEKNKELHKFLKNYAFSIPIHLLIKNTESSLHSFVELHKAFQYWDSCCLTTTDTVFEPETFGRYIEKFQQGDMDGLFAVTPFVDDESPLYVTVDNDQRIVCFSDKKYPQASFVSGGIYCLRRKAIDAAATSLAAGNHRMRNYQRFLIDQGLDIKAYPFAKIIDVDHLHDRETAEYFLLEQKLKV